MADSQNLPQHLEAWYHPRAPEDASLPSRKIYQVVGETSESMQTSHHCSFIIYHHHHKAQERMLFIHQCLHCCIFTIPIQKMVFLSSSLPEQCLAGKPLLMHSGELLLPVRGKECRLHVEIVRLYFPLPKFK